MTVRLEPTTKPSSLDGCPMFAPAYMGRKRRAQPFHRFCYVGKKTAAKSKIRVQ
jgi:hypothetical protein